jgi:hypothetical protein
MPLPKNFHAHHSPFGAFASFTCGLVTAFGDPQAEDPGGFGQSLRKPASNNVYIAWRRGKSSWQALPFFRPRADRAAEFTGEQAAKAKASRPVTPIPESKYQRTFGLASDRFESGPLAFTLLSPFDRIEELTKLDRKRQQFLVAPVVIALLEGDNTKGKEPLELMFGTSESSQGQRPLQDVRKDLVGFAVGRRYGFAAKPGKNVSARQGFDAFVPARADAEGLHRLGGDACLVFTVPPGQRACIPIALGFHQAGLVTTGIEAPYYYTQFFACLEDVLAYGLANHAAYGRLAAQRDAELDRSNLSPEQRWLVAHSVHSYLGSSELLVQKKKPLWVVNEGEYRMMNTFDLTVDHLFFELDFWPWAMRDVLDLYASRYSYRDSLHDPDGNRADGGISFTHDMGVDDQFSPVGRSSYECTNLTDCFSHMTAEQLINWICCAVTYGEARGDRGWLKKHRRTLLDCAESLRRRDHGDEAKRTGLIQWDSDRCGPQGAEITTYDSLDISLGQARNNLYLATKAYAAWLLLERAFERLGLEKDALRARESAALLARTLASKFEADTRMFPAVFEAGNQSRIIPAIEGLVFPLYLGMRELLEERPEAAELMRLFALHLESVLVRGVCLDAESGGFKLSSTSENTWKSKIMLCQHVARELFPKVLGPKASAAADKVHVGFQAQSLTRTLAYCDQLRSTDGHAFGSKYYPRGVTSWLWLREKKTRG